MDDAPFTGDLDLAAVTTRDELIALLQTVYARADKPSLRTLEARARHEATPLSRTPVSEMLRGARFPHKAVMIAFLRACGMPDDDTEPWRRAWERIASSEEGPAWSESTQAVPGQPPTEITAGVDPAEVNQLREQVSRLTEANERLRAQLAASEQQVTDGLRPGEATGGQETPGPPARRSMWHFPDGSRVMLVSSHLPADLLPASAEPGYLNYVRYSALADLDSVIEIYDAIRTYNPASQVVIMAAQELHQSDVANDLVLIGGLTWQAVTQWFSRTFSTPIEFGDPDDRGAIVVRDPDGEVREFGYQMDGDELVEDIGFFVRGENPSAPKRTLTICGGITTRGVLGAARCFTDPEMRERNEQYLVSRFPEGSTYCIVMRVPVLNRDPLAPDLSRKENRLFEWSKGGPKAG